MCFLSLSQKKIFLTNLAVIIFLPYASNLCSYRNADIISSILYAIPISYEPQEGAHVQKHTKSDKFRSTIDKNDSALSSHYEQIQLTVLQSAFFTPFPQSEANLVSQDSLRKQVEPSSVRGAEQVILVGSDVGWGRLDTHWVGLVG